MKEDRGLSLYLVGSRSCSATMILVCFWDKSYQLRPEFRIFSPTHLTVCLTMQPKTSCLSCASHLSGYITTWSVHFIIKIHYVCAKSGIEVLRINRGSNQATCIKGEIWQTVPALSFVQTQLSFPGAIAPAMDRYCGINVTAVVIYLCINYKYFKRVNRFVFLQREFCEGLCM